jgi:predicted transcriptional regulator
MKDKIQLLRSQNLTYRQIAKELGCTKSLVCYYLGQNQREKRRNRQTKLRQKNHPFLRKLERFSAIIKYSKRTASSTHYLKLINKKIWTFNIMSKRDSTYTKPTFTVQDIFDKFGERPVCYLTGEPIDITKTRTYEFDHKIPRSQGGDNTIDNLGICTRTANQSKINMNPEQFLTFCRSVLEHHGYTVNKS